MAIKFTNPVMRNVGIGFDVSGGSKVDLVVEGGDYQDVGTFFIERDPISLYQYVGLPAETPPELVKELLQALIKQQHSAEGSAEQVVKSSRLWDFIKHADSAASVLQKFVFIAGKGEDFMARILS